MFNDKNEYFCPGSKNKHMFSHSQKISSIVLAALFTLIAPLVKAQNDVLFTIAGKPVTTQEFEYVYNKNNFNNSADYSEASLNDYLKLFVKYKLKVAEAYATGLDTVPALKREYEGYDQQLFDNYINKQILDKLIVQEYNRSKTDVGVSHIFIKEDSASTAEGKIQQAYQKLKAGESFESVAKEFSQDENSRNNGGFLGYFTALQIGYPQLEDVVYSTPKGSFSAPVKTPIGYHIVRVNDIRPARGRIKIAIIKRMLTEDGSAENIVDSLYKELKNGANFSDLALKYSEDYNTNAKSGEMDWFGINTYASPIEEAAFALEKDGDIAVPVKTSSAWYIIKRLSRTVEQTLEEAEPVFKLKLLKSRMYISAMNDYVTAKKKEYGFKEDAAVLKEFKARIVPLINENPYFYQPVAYPKMLLTVANRTYTENEVGEMLSKVWSNRNNLHDGELFDAVYNDAVNKIVLEEFKNRLPNENFEYKALLDEYKNGVLIFELTRNNVWEKASKDTVQLRAFYEKNKSNYMWNERASVRKFKLAEMSQLTQLKSLMKKNKNTAAEDWSVKLSQAGMGNVIVEDLVIEKDKSEESSAIIWKAGATTVPDEKNMVIYQTISVQPSTTKSFEECRGYVIAAFQDSLEKAWIDGLANKFPVQINQAVLNSLVKK